MSRLTDNDKRFGPFTYGRASWRPVRMVFSTGGGDDEHPCNHITGYVFGWVARLNLPTRVAPWRHWVDTSHYEWSRGPGSGYWEVHPREYGFSLHEGFFQLFLGAQTHDSRTTKSWSKHLPWTQWRHIRMSLYDTRGKHFWTEWERDRKLGHQWEARQAVEAACPKAVFEFDDYDGERIQATTHIQEREWRFGEGWFKWLSVFRRPRIRRSLDIEFSKEVGPEKGSWKGGTLGHGIDMQPGETHEEAFRRYCEQDHRSKYRPFRISFVGRIAT
jgi:hypothetical protein